MQSSKLYLQRTYGCAAMLPRAVPRTPRVPCQTPRLHHPQQQLQQHQPLIQQQHARQTVVQAALAGSHVPEGGPDKKMSSYLKLARIHNMVPSMLLVVVGAWAGAGHSLSAVQRWSVWFMSLISAGIAVASVVVNDYFDLKLDTTNAPDKPLPSGAIAPDAALLLSSVLYCGCLIAACLMEPSRLRSIVAFSAAATLLYTPLFKKLTAIKNATVATVIALAPLAGALAAGAGDAGLLRLAPATLFAFSGVMFREILMDMNDLEGDRSSGVWTLPVLLGKPAALICALGFTLAGCAGALLRLLAAPGSLGEVFQGSGGVAGSSGFPLLQQALTRLGVSWDPSWGAAVVVGAPVVVLLMAVWKLGRLALGVWRSGFDEKVVGAAVDECLKPVGWGIILLAALG